MLTELAVRVIHPCQGLPIHMEDQTGRLWWEAEHFYNPPEDHPYGVILLNEALNQCNTEFFLHIWNKATVRVCVDGAANQFNKLTSSKGVSSKKSDATCNDTVLATSPDGQEGCPLPDFITGDFDSVHSELLKQYKEMGTSIVETPDQDETDFTKSVRELRKYILKKDIELKHILAIAAVSNERFDHVIANLSTLHKVENIVPVPVVVTSGPSLFWLLNEGDHTIKVPLEVVLNSRRSWCGLVPLGYPSAVTTSGLKWNLDNQVLSFGHLVSTSNTYDPTHDGQVTIRTCQPLLWTMGWDIERLYCVSSPEAQSSKHQIETPSNNAIDTSSE